MTSPSTLNAEAIQSALDDLPMWQVKDQALERVYRGKSYMDALDKLNAIARLAEEANHHPDLTLQWKTLIVRYWTHTVNGITDLDIGQAEAAEKLLV